MDQYIEIIKAASDCDRDAILRMSREMKLLTGYESKVRGCCFTSFLIRTQSTRLFPLLFKKSKEILMFENSISIFMSCRVHVILKHINIDLFSGQKIEFLI